MLRYCVMLLAGWVVPPAQSFAPSVSIHPPLFVARRCSADVIHCCEPPSEPSAEKLAPEMTKVGSKAYYEGFLTQPIDESVTVERGDGTEQAVKFAASSFVVIAFLFLGFMASNGLLG